MLRVSNKVNYKTVSSQALEKWKAFYSHLYSESDDYVLVYENGEEMQFLPGSAKEFFTLERYQQELGKDFNRITLFLCTSFDYNIAHGLNDSDGENDLFNSDITDSSGTCLEPASHESPPTTKCLKVNNDSDENSQKDLQIQNDEKLALELQQSFEDEMSSEINEEYSTPVVQNKCDGAQEEFIDQASIIQHLEKMTDIDNQFFIVMRRKVPFLGYFPYGNVKQKKHLLCRNSLLNMLVKMELIRGHSPENSSLTVWIVCVLICFQTDALLTRRTTSRMEISARVGK